MDKDKPQGGGGGRGLPPHSPHHGSLASPSSAAPGCGVAERGRFSQDISRMPENPPRSTGHRRAQSEILGLPDDLAFDSDLGIVGQPGDGPSLSDETEEDVFSMYIDMDKFGASGPGLPDAEASMSATTATSTASATGSESLNLGSNERVRVRHQHSQSMDGSTSIKLEMLASSSEGPSLAEAKKAMSAAKLAELALVDPKRAKRIWANRQSAARSKERKMRYIAELERRVQALQTEATTLSAQLTVLQRDTTNLTAENSELKLRLQAMEQQNNLQEALNDAMREEIQRLRVATGLAVPNGGQMNSGASTFGANQQYYHHNYAMQSLLAAQHLQQLQIRTRQQQQQVHPNKHQVQQEQQPPSDQKMKEAMTPETQKESTSDSNSTSNE